MILDFSATFHARLQELVAGHRFPRPRGDEAEPEIVRSTIPPRPVGYQEGDECPLVRWSLHRGEARQNELAHDIIVNCLIWTPGDPGSGAELIERLVSLLVLGLRSDQGLAGHRLALPIGYFFGDQGEHDRQGMQPHPYHEGGLTLQYIAPHRRISCITPQT